MRPRDTERHALIASLAETKTHHEIADIIGLDAMAVYMHCRNHGIRARIKPRGDKARIEKMAALIRRGLETAHVAERFGTTTDNVKVLLHKHGYSIRKLRNA